jgi:Clp protease
MVGTAHPTNSLSCLASMVGEPDRSEPQLPTPNSQLPMSVDRILNVPYNLPGSQYWQWINIYTRMSQNRIIFLDRPITDGLANSIIASLLYLESVDNAKPIYLYINSSRRCWDGKI